MQKGPIISPYSTYFSEQNQNMILMPVLCKPGRVIKAQNFIEPLKWLVYHQPNPVHINGPVNQGLFLSLKNCLKKLKFYMYYLLQRKLVNSTYLQSNLYSHHIGPYVMQIVCIEMSKSKKH